MRIEVLMVRVPICSTSFFFQRWKRETGRNENEENSLKYPLNCLPHSHLQHTHARAYWHTSGRELSLILKYDNIVVPFISIWTH